MEIKDFKHNPMLKQLLENYCIRIYEKEAILDDWNLLLEYYYLKRTNQLDLLFEEENLGNSFLDEISR